MINNELLKILSPITDEERKILDGNDAIDRNIYYSAEKPEVMTSEKLLSAGKNVSVRTHTRFVHFPEHTHDYVEIIYMCAGRTTHIVDKKTVNLEEGELLLLSPGATQEILPADEGDVALNFIVRPEYFDSVLRMLGEEDTPLRSFLINCIKTKSGAGYLHFKVSDVLPVQNLIENLVWAFVNETPNKRNINQVTMGLLFLQLINHTDRLEYTEADESLAVKVLRYVEENYKNASLSDLAALLHYDISALSREIKRRTGKNYTEILLEKRLSQCSFLLKNTDMTIDEIAMSVGYENKSFFYSQFAKKYGMSPRKYRLDSKG